MAEYIFRFKISMKEAIFMKVCYTGCNFKKYRSNLVLCETSVIFLGSGVDLVQVAFEIVKYKIQLRIGKYDFPQHDDILMI